jgi:hypothetical protein
MFQHFVPSGGSEQAKAATYASCLPVSLRLPRGRGDSLGGVLQPAFHQAPARPLDCGEAGM